MRRSGVRFPSAPPAFAAPPLRLASHRIRRLPAEALAKAGFDFLTLCRPRLARFGWRGLSSPPALVPECIPPHESDRSRAGLAAAPPAVRPVLDRAGVRQFRLPDGGRGDGMADVRHHRL